MLDEIVVLFVEDEPEIRSVMEEFIKDSVKKIYVAKDGVEGLELFKQYKPDIVLSDINMPNMNGIEMVREIKQESPKTPVVLLTAFNELKYLQEAIEIGVNKYITKPINGGKFFTTLNDLAEEVLTYNKLEEKNILLQQYRDTVDRSSIVSKTDAKGIITYVNEQFCEISGYTYEELIGQPHNIVRHPDMESSVYAELWNRIKKEKKPWKGEIKNKKKDGGYYWVNTIVNPILDKNNEIIEFIAVRTDITNEVKMRDYFNEQLKITSKQFNNALNLSKEYEKAINESNIVSRTDSNGFIIYVNDKFCKVSGYSREELMGKSHNIIRHEDTNKSVFKNLWSTIKSGEIWRGTLKNKNKNNDPYWVNTTIVPIVDEKGKIIEYMAIRYDLTDLFELHEEVEESQREIIYKMGEIGETRSKETGNHVKRVAYYSRELARLYGLDKKECDILFTASPMHDIGKVGIPDSILHKAGKLDEQEWKTMKEHSIIGKRILQGSKRPVIHAASIVAYEHHERFDGTGYPRGLAGEDIHIYGRITAIADVFDALGSDRCYKKAWDDEKIFALLKEESGKQFDPKLVELFFDNLEIFLDIRDRFKDKYE